MQRWNNSCANLQLIVSTGISAANYGIMTNISDSKEDFYDVEDDFCRDFCVVFCVA